jgi:hypothetical protein
VLHVYRRLSRHYAALRTTSKANANEDGTISTLPTDR